MFVRNHGGKKTTAKILMIVNSCVGDDTKITNMINTSDPIKMINRWYYEQFYNNIFHNLDEIDKLFENQNLPKLTLEEEKEKSLWDDSNVPYLGKLFSFKI